VVLRETVDVNRETIRLSDLLPEHAEAAVKDKSNEIELGRAPEPGSLRVFEAAQIAARLANQPVLLNRLAIPSRIVIQRSGWPIASENVRNTIASFLQQQGLKYGELPDSAVLRFAGVGSRQQAPTLEVAAATWDDRQQALEFRLHCVDRTLCGSFLVRANMAPALAATWRAKLRPEMSGNRPRQTAGAPNLGAALAEAGKPATLILDGANLRISVQVICLDRGVLNQQIRVFDAKNRRVFRAEVVGARLLHAIL
jgi:hypothetical protein